MSEGRRYPIVSIIMPAYNAEQYIRISIESILAQTFSDFELIILDDASTDNTLAIIRSFEDNRIRCFDSAENKKIVYQLNRGLSLAQGKYIARMDADDIAAPNRLQKQVQLLEAQSDLVIVGSAFHFINPTGKKISNTLPPLFFNSKAIALASLFYIPFIHPTVMMRRTVLEDWDLKYEQDFWIAEDFHLFNRILQKGRGYNINEDFLSYRLHPTQSTQTKKEIQINAVERTIKMQFEYFGVPVSKSEWNIHRLILLDHFHSLSASQLLEIKTWLLELEERVISSGFNINIVQQVFKTVWFYTCWKGKSEGYSSYFIYKRASWSPHFLSKINIKLFFACSLGQFRLIPFFRSLVRKIKR